MITEFMLFTDGGAFPKDEGKFTAVHVFRLFKVERDKKGEIENTKLIYEEAEVHDEKTCAYAEISALAKGLENLWKYVKATELKKIKVSVYTDSMLCYKSLTEWIYTWLKTAKDGIFYSSSGKPVANQKEIKIAFEFIHNLHEYGTIKLFHINSHVAKKNVKKLKEKFEHFNKCSISDLEFLFIYAQNAKCDELVKEKYDNYIGNNN
jgi:ribonuclease HI